MRRTPNARAIAPIAAAALTVGLFAGVLCAGVAGARLASSTAKGTTACFLSGSITASPPLTLGSG